MRFFRSRAEVEADRLQSRIDVLRSRDVPDAFIDDLATRRESWLGFASGVVFLPVLLVAMYGWWRLLPLILVLPWLRPTEPDQLLVLAGPAYFLGFLGSAFALIMIVGWMSCLAYRRPGPHPAPSTAASLLRDASIGGGGAIVDWLYGGSVRAAAPAATPEDFLQAFGRHQRRLWGRVALVLTVAVVVAMAWGANDYWLASPEGLTLRGPFASRTLDWRDATQVTLGCEAYKDGDDTLVYDIELAGKTIDLGAGASPDQAIPIPRRLAALDQIDAALRDAAVPRRLKGAADPACVARWSRLAGPKGAARIERLLRAAS